MAENPLFWGWSVPTGEDVASWGWAPSGGEEPLVPAVALLYPANQQSISDNDPILIWYVTSDPDSLGVHIQFDLALSPVFLEQWTYSSILDPTNWQKASDPFTAWVPIGGGADVGQRIRFQCPALSRGTWRLRFRATDGVTTSDWSVSYYIVAGQRVYCTIGGVEYKTIGFQVTERTGGEGSPFSFRIPLSALDANPITRGSEVSVALSIGAQSRTWVGTVESLTSHGAEVTIDGLMLDAYLSRKLVSGVEEYDDVGVILAAFVDDYGSPLVSTSMDTSLGIDTTIRGQYRSLLDHLGGWADLLGLMLYVDADGDVHLQYPSDLGDPTYVIYEAAP